MQVVDLATGEVREAKNDDDVQAKGAPVSIDDFIREAQEVEWVVEGRVASRALTVFAGPAKLARKSLLLQHMVLCVARGNSWCGHDTRAREVVFVGFEGGRSLLALRFVEVGHHVDPDRPILAGFADGLAGYEWCMARLRQAKQRKEPWPVLIVIDTLSQVLARKGLDENDNMTMTVALAEHDELAYAAEAAILTTHHFSKGAATYRGASAIAAIANRCEVHPVEGQLGTVRMEWTLRHGPGGEDAARVSKPNGRFEFDPVDPATLPRETKRGGRRGGRPAFRLEDQLRNYLQAREGEEVSYEQIAEDLAKASEVTGKPVKYATIRRDLPKLCEPYMSAGQARAVTVGKTIVGVRWGEAPK